MLSELMSRSCMVRWYSLVFVSRWLYQRVTQTLPSINSYVRMYFSWKYYVQYDSEKSPASLIEVCGQCSVTRWGAVQLDTLYNSSQGNKNNLVAISASATIRDRRRIPQERASVRAREIEERWRNRELENNLVIQVLALIVIMGSNDLEGEKRGKKWAMLTYVCMYVGLHGRLVVRLSWAR